tara:strand:+ start:96 stop:530 length:435 start_codon:yes stop_codon:yes gene_type:complete
MSGSETRVLGNMVRIHNDAFGKILNTAYEKGQTKYGPGGGEVVYKKVIDNEDVSEYDIQFDIYYEPSTYSGLHVETCRLVQRLRPSKGYNGWNDIYHLLKVVRINLKKNKGGGKRKRRKSKKRKSKRKKSKKSRKRSKTRRRRR